VIEKNLLNEVKATINEIARNKNLNKTLSFKKLELVKSQTEDKI